MEYDEALEFIEYTTRLKSLKTFDGTLKRMRELCRTLGNPQNSLKFVHITGTNGKGSTTSFIFTILLKSGYNVGKYTTPLIRTYNDQFQVNDKILSKEMFCEIVEEIKKACNDMVSRGFTHPIFFEVKTVLAFLYFKKMNCDIVILEVGIGGLLDSTNVIDTTVLSVITSISKDHTELIGDTLEEITEQKCGIMRNGVPTASGIQNAKVTKVMKRISIEKNSDLKILHKNEISNVEYGLEKQSFTLNNKHYEIKIPGNYQIENAALAINSANILKENGFDKITGKSISEGLANTSIYGRFQLINKNPIFIIDGAHNEDAALRLKESMNIYLKDKNKILILAMLKDKDVEKVVSILAPEAGMVFTCTGPNNKRNMKSKDLADIVYKYNKNVCCCDSIDEAVRLATSKAGKNDAVIACGTISYLGRILEIYY